MKVFQIESRSSIKSPEERLAYAVIIQAMRDIKRHCFYNGNDKKEKIYRESLYRRAKNWIESRSGTFNFFADFTSFGADQIHNMAIEKIEKWEKRLKSISRRKRRNEENIRKRATI